MAHLSIRGVTFISADVLSYGDYDNSCAVERANVRYLQEQHADKTVTVSMQHATGGEMSELAYSEYMADGWRINEALLADLQGAELIIAEGLHGSVQAWIADSVDESEGYTASLSDYPCFDDELVSKVEQELTEEAMKDWLLRDIESAMNSARTEANPDCDDIDLEEAEAWAAWGACEIWPTIEAGGSVYVSEEDVTRMGKWLAVERNRNHNPNQREFCF